MNSETLLIVIGIPAIISLTGYFIPRKFWRILAMSLLLATGICACICLKLFLQTKNLPILWTLENFCQLGFWQGRIIFRADSLAIGMALIGSLLSFFILLWAVGYFWKSGKERDEDSDKLKSFFINSSWMLSLSFGVFFSEHLLVLAIFWGFLALPFYLMLSVGNDQASDSGKKALLFIFATDTLLILGIAILWQLKTQFQLSQLTIFTNTKSALMAYFLIASAGWSKAGIVPFHSWIPDASANCPAPAIALVPACLDKILGIYLLTRISLDLFSLTVPVRGFLLLLGAFTIFAGVVPALVQKNFRKLLGFHSISQAGYMLLGIATTNPAGIIGGLFHLVNNVIYKPLLFLCAGEIEKKTGIQELSQLGGFSKFLPTSFFSFLVASLAISGVPPLNGFFSKWLIYQSILELAKEFPRIWIFILVSAMFGSSLTLASFIKLIYSVYLSPSSQETIFDKQKAGQFLMHFSMVIMALSCIALGIFGNWLGLKWFLEPMLGNGLSGLSGFWYPGLATVFLLTGLGGGGLFYWLSRRMRFRLDESYLFGEESKEASYSALDFYEVLEKELGFISRCYQAVERGWIDLYYWGQKLVFYFSERIQAVHQGNVLNYLAWCVLGFLVLLSVFLGAS